MGLDCVKYLFEKLHIRQSTITQISYIFHSSYSPELEAVRAEGGRRGALGGPHPAQDHGPGMQSDLELELDR